MRSRRNSKDRNGKWRWELKGRMMFVKRSDPRYAEFAEYKKKHGFSPDELWSLDLTLANFILPRLKAFREVCPSDMEEAVDRMIRAFEILAEENSPYPSRAEQFTIDEGLYAFAKYFQGLWC